MKPSRKQLIEKVLDYSARVEADISEHDTGWFYHWSSAVEKLKYHEHEESKPKSITPAEGLALLAIAGDESVPPIQVKGKARPYGDKIVNLIAVGGGSLPFLVEDVNAHEGPTTWHSEFFLEADISEHDKPEADLLATLSECITDEGSVAFSRLAVEDAHRRLNYINEIARAAIAQAKQ